MNRTDEEWEILFTLGAQTLIELGKAIANTIIEANKIDAESEDIPIPRRAAESIVQFCLDASKTMQEAKDHLL